MTSCYKTQWSSTNFQRFFFFFFIFSLLHFLLLRRQWRVKLRFVRSCSCSLSFSHFLLKSLLTNRRLRSSFWHWTTPTFPTPSRSIISSSFSSTHHGMSRFCSSSRFNSTCSCQCLKPKNVMRSKSWKLFHSLHFIRKKGPRIILY